MSSEHIDEILEELQEFINELKKRYTEIINKEITDWDTIKAVISFFITFSKKTCIVDFIDICNWDYIASHSFDDSNRILEMIWHDYTDAPDNDEMRLTIYASGAHKTLCQIQINSIMLSANKGFPTLLIKSTFREEKQINREFNNGCSDFHKEKSRLFSIDIAKVVKKKVHRITIPNINCYTVSLVPKSAIVIRAHDSKMFLYTMNMKLAIDRIADSIKLLSKINNNDFEEIKDKGNRIRRDFENALKILNLNRGTQHSKDYQKLMLGDLTSALDTSTVLMELGLNLDKTVTVLNQCSHDSGVNVPMDDLILASVYVLYVISQQKINEF